MAFINWIKDYSVGVGELDHQHQKLMEIINKLFELYQAKQFSTAEVEPIFKELFDYADYHFGTEENYFKLYNYPHKNEHIGTHNVYREKMRGLKDKYDQEKNPEILFEIANFLNDWWIWHINHIDKEYTKYFNANGLL